MDLNRLIHTGLYLKQVKSRYDFFFFHKKSIHGLHPRLAFNLVSPLNGNLHEAQRQRKTAQDTHLENKEGKSPWSKIEQ